MNGAELSTVPKEARPYQGATAGIVTRLVANTIDAAVVGVMLGAGYLGVVSVIFLLDPTGFVWPEGNVLASLTTALTVATTYLWLSWWLFGRSYGDHVMGIRVTSRRKPKLGPLRALARAAFCVFFPIGLFWCAVSPKRRSVQDIVLFSTVVYDWLPRPPAAGTAQPAAAGKAPVGEANAGDAPAGAANAGEAPVDPQPAAEPPAAGDAAEGPTPPDSRA